jgi:hypothetical protein
MQPAMLYTATCPCGWHLEPNLKTTVDEYVRHHKTRCELWNGP